MRKLFVLVAAHAALFVVSPILSGKVVSFCGVEFLGGMLTMTLAFGLLDVINDGYGLEKARDTVVAAAVVRLVSWSSVAMVMLLPSVRTPPQFDAVMAESLRVLLAGEVSLLTSQYLVDVRVFDWVRRRTARGFWLRYNLSNLASQVVGMAVFVTLALWGTGTSPWRVFVGGLLLRVSLSLLLTPLFMAVARWTAIGSGALLLLAQPARAFELGPTKLDSAIRLMWSDGNAYRLHGEALTLLRPHRDAPVWLQSMLFVDRLTEPSSIVPRPGASKPLPWTNWNEKVTVGVDVGRHFSIVAQYQYVTSPATKVLRAGLEARF